MVETRNQEDASSQHTALSIKHHSLLHTPTPATRTYHGMTDDNHGWRAWPHTLVERQNVLNTHSNILCRHSKMHMVSSHKTIPVIRTPPCNQDTHLQSGHPLAIRTHPCNQNQDTPLQSGHILAIRIRTHPRNQDTPLQSGHTHAIRTHPCNQDTPLQSGHTLAIRTNRDTPLQSGHPDTQDTPTHPCN
jgi:hypothetical protein